MFNGVHEVNGTYDCVNRFVLCVSGENLLYRNLKKGKKSLHQKKGADVAI